MDREFTEEAAFHLEMETRELIRGGMDPAQARRHANIAFGGVESHREKARDARGVRPLEELIQDDGLMVVGAEYSLETGIVDFCHGLPERP